MHIFCSQATFGSLPTSFHNNLQQILVKPMLGLTSKTKSDKSRRIRPPKSFKSFIIAQATAFFSGVQFTASTITTVSADLHTYLVNMTGNASLAYSKHFAQNTLFDVARFLRPTWARGSPATSGPEHPFHYRTKLERANAGKLNVLVPNNNRLKHDQLQRVLWLVVCLIFVVLFLSKFVDRSGNQHDVTTSSTSFDVTLLP